MLLSHWYEQHDSKSHQSHIFPFQKVDWEVFFAHDGDSILIKSCKATLVWIKPTAILLQVHMNKKDNYQLHLQPHFFKSLILFPLCNSFLALNNTRPWTDRSWSCFCESPLIQLLFCRSPAAGGLFVERQSDSLAGNGGWTKADPLRPPPRLPYRQGVGGLLMSHLTPGYLTPPTHKHCGKWFCLTLTKSPHGLTTVYHPYVLMMTMKPGICTQFSFLKKYNFLLVFVIFLTYLTSYI